MENRILYVVFGIAFGLWLGTRECNTKDESKPVYVESGTAVKDSVITSKAGAGQTSKFDSSGTSKFKYITKWKHDTIPLYVKDTSGYLKDHLTIREYNKSFDFKDACIDVNSVVWQNELTYQNVSYSAVSPLNSGSNVTKVPNYSNVFIGLNTSFPTNTSVDLSLAYRHDNYLFSVGRSLNNQRWSVGVSKGIF